MNKFQRIQLVRLLGLNTEESVLIEHASDMRQYSRFFEGISNVSVRTFRGNVDAPYEPHFPYVSWPEFEAECLPLLDEGYNLVVAKGIDPSRADLAGCILRRPEDFVVEVAFGPGTVRRVTHLGQIDYRATVKRPVEPGIPEKIREALTILWRREREWPVEDEIRNVLYEFSVYRLPVGWRAEPTIFWEIRGMDGNDTRLEQAYRRLSQ